MTGAKKSVFEVGPWLFSGRPLILKNWHPELTLSKEDHSSIPLWIKIFNVPLQFWTDEGLSHISSAVGRPIHVDSLTSSKRRLNFARICVEVSANSQLIDSFDLEMEINGNIEKVEISVEYQWRPKTCHSCKIFGHSDSTCPKMATATAWKPKNLPQKPEDSRSVKGKSIISTVEFVSPELPTISAVVDVNPTTSTQAQEQQITQNPSEALPPSQNEQDSQVYSILESTCMLPAHPSLQSPNSFESLQVQEGQLIVDISPSTRKHFIESHQLNTKGHSTKKKKGKKKPPITGRLRMF